MVETRKEQGGSFPFTWRFGDLGQTASLCACFWKQLGFLGAVIQLEHSREGKYLRGKNNRKCAFKNTLVKKTLR